MSKQTWNETIVRQKTSGTEYGTFTTAKTIIAASDVRTFPPDFFEIGTGIDIEVWGGIGNLVTTPGTITFQVMLGSVISFTTGAIQLNATAHTDLPFWLRIGLTCRSVGSGTSATFMGQGVIVGKQITVTAGQTDGANTNSVLMVPATTPAVGTGWDSTASQKLDFFAGFSISDAANTVTVDQYTVTVKN